MTVLFDRLRARSGSARSTTGQWCPQFDLPAAGRSGSAPDLNYRRLGRYLRGYESDTIPLLREAAEYLARLNSWQVKTSRRLRLTEIVLSHVGHLITDFYRHHLRHGGGLPELKSRRTSLQLCVHVIEALAISVKHVIAHDCGSAPPLRPKVRARVDLCAFRVLELTCWEQRLRALRYQKLPAEAWREANDTFFYLDQGGISDRLMPLVVNLDLRTVGATDQALATAQDLFISLHVFGLLDVLSWPSKLIAGADTYLRLLDPPLRTRAIGQCEPTEDCVMVARGWAGSAGPVNREAQAAGQPGVSFTIAPLRELLEEEYEALTREQLLGSDSGYQAPAGLRYLTVTERLSLVQSLLGRIDSRARVAERKPARASRDVLLYAGLHESGRLFYEHRTSALRSSAAIAPVAGSAVASPNCWHVVNESRSGMLLSKSDDQNAAHLDAGQLVSYCEADVPDAALGLAYVSRLQRNEGGGIDVAIRRLDGQAEHVAVQLPEDKTELLPAFLLDRPQGERQIVVPARKQFAPGTPLMLVRGAQLCPVRLGALRLSRREFLLFELRAPRI